MNSKLLVGFTFSSSVLSQKINGFRLRYDAKYFSQPNLVMSLCRPFVIDSNDENELIGDLSDELESFLFGHEANLSLSFTGIDIFAHGKNKILYFNPIMPDPIEHCAESLDDITRSFIYDKDQKYRNDTNKLFLPIASIFENNQIDTAVNTARFEFDFPLELPLASVSLFKKRGSHWYEREVLHPFVDASNRFLQMGAS